MTFGVLFRFDANLNIYFQTAKFLSKNIKNMHT